MILAMVENMSNKSNDYKRDAQSDEIKSSFRAIRIDWIYNYYIVNIYGSHR